MGGQNHQPTNRLRLIAPSALLSQRVGEALVCVLDANSQLENAIIVGMDRLHVADLVSAFTNSVPDYVGLAIKQLEASLEAVVDIRELYAHLLSAAALEGYRGNPLASRVREFDLPTAFSGTLVLPAINGHAWEQLERRVEEMNVLRTLEWEADEFTAVAEPTRRLIDVLQTCKTIAEERGGRRMVEAIECNELPLRQAFAQVFSLWNHLHAMFLYSSLIMTEMFYRTNSFGSLLPDAGEVSAEVSA